jgi:hypothetical protein
MMGNWVASVTHRLLCRDERQGHSGRVEPLADATVVHLAHRDPKRSVVTVRYIRLAYPISRSATLSKSLGWALCDSSGRLPACRQACRDCRICHCNAPRRPERLFHVSNRKRFRSKLSGFSQRKPVAHSPPRRVLEQYESIVAGVRLQTRSVELSCCRDVVQTWGITSQRTEIPQATPTIPTHITTDGKGHFLRQGRGIG